jgi:hypothetical protein
MSVAMIVASPPYAESIDSRNGPSGLNVKFRKDGKPMAYGRDQLQMNAEGYGSSLGQLGAMKEGNPNMETTLTQCPVTTWAGCYDDNWKRLIVDEAFAHPAKYARGLIRRIYAHALERGYLKPGDSVVDPFGGVALGGLDASMLGLHWRGCELEPRFVALAEKNIALWNRYQPTGSARIVQGDSRNLVAVLGEAGAIVSSPPFCGSDHRKGGSDLQRDWAIANGRNPDAPNMASKITVDPYGQTPGQLGSMKEGDVGAVISSPPYSGIHPEANGSGPDKEKQYATYRASGGGASFEAFCKTQAKHSQGYGNTPGNLASLPPGVAGIVSSPPFSERHAYADEARNEARAEKLKASGAGIGGTRGLHKPSGEHPDNLAQKQDETFWAAAKTIVQQCYLILKPGGYCYWITKDFVRNKARVPFSDQWRQLCESAGFETVEWIKASLVKEWDENTLFNGVETKRKERKSFFRRLAEKKGSPRIDHEDVIVMRKPGGGDEFAKQASQWTTPQVSEPDSAPRPSRAATGRTTEYLGRQVQWMTPAADGQADKEYTRDGGQKGAERLAIAGQALAFSPPAPHPSTGPESSETPPGSPPRSAKRRLNPYFVEWLQGMPAGWTSPTALIDCAAWETWLCLCRERLRLLCSCGG